MVSYFAVYQCKLKCLWSKHCKEQKDKLPAAPFPMPDPPAFPWVQQSPFIQKKSRALALRVFTLMRQRAQMHVQQCAGTNSKKQKA